MPASSPSLSRLVEAICIHLCEKHPAPRTQHGNHGRNVYTSRWRLVLAEYNAIRARIFNSQALEDVNLQLFHINETTLMTWYKDNVRRDEVKLLMKGLDVPTTSLISKEKLPPAMTKPSSPPQSMAESHEFPEVHDTTGQAKLRGQVTARLAKSVEMDDQPAEASTPPAPTISRTTDWRRRKAKAEEDQPASKVPRKIYACKTCGEAMMTAGHTQYKGRRYCPQAPGQIPKEEWLALRKEEDRLKKAAAAKTD